MQQRFSHVREGFLLPTRMVHLALWPLTQASCLSRRTGILTCCGTSRLGSLRDNSGWKPKLLRG